MPHAGTGSADGRLICDGRRIPTVSYCDQPYIVRTNDGAWLCCVTTGAGNEGEPGQHVTTLRSVDQGRTWSDPVRVEPAGSVENSYAVMLKAPSGRIFVFYNHNTDNVREIKSHDGTQTLSRVDSLGYFVFKYSDDHGRSWSTQRHPIPVREFACDRENVFGGKIRFFWNVGKAFAHDGAAFVPLHKVGKMGRGFFAQSEGVLLKSPNLLAVADPARALWETLPDGDVGLRTPPGGGPVSEEQNFCVLSDGSFHCVYRCIDGYPVETYSRDGGHTWSIPRYKCYADGRRIKHPRAANFVWKCANGKYLYWFHNHGGRFIGERPDAADMAYDDRNPVWLSAGIEADSPEGRIILWSQPEILLYDDDPFIRMSYPDLVEEDGHYFITETQKQIARVHEIPGELPEGMWLALELSVAEEPSAAGVDSGAVLLGLPEAGKTMPASVGAPSLPHFVVRDHTRYDMGGKDVRRGFAIELVLKVNEWTPGQMILDSRTPAGQGLCLATTPRKTLQLVLDDGRCDCRWESDPVLEPGRWHHVVINVDGGPKIISFIVDGRFCDGGDFRQFGWGRFNPNLRHANGDERLRIGPTLKGTVGALRLYSRCLRTYEAVGLAMRSVGRP